MLQRTKQGSRFSYSTRTTTTRVPQNVLSTSSVLHNHIKCEGNEGAYQKFVVHSFHDDFLRLVLADIEPEFQQLVIAFVLNQRGAEAIQPSPHLALLSTSFGCCSAVSDRGTVPC